MLTAILVINVCMFAFTALVILYECKDPADALGVLFFIALAVANGVGVYLINH